jgi:signal transduction histidine kinase
MFMETDSNETTLTDVAYLACDANFCIVQASAGAAALLDLPQEHICGQELTAVCLPLMGNEPQLATVRDGTLARFAIEQINLPTPDGTMRYVSLVVLPLGAGVIAILTDVTAHSLQQQQIQQQHHDLALLHERLAEQNQQLRSLNQELTELMQRKSDMLAIATHDLRSPAATILGFVGLLLEGEFDPLTAQQQEILGIVSQEADRTLSLIKSLLDLKRLESIHLINITQVNMHDLLQQVLRSFQNQAQLATIELVYHGLHVDGQPQDNRHADEYTVMGDSDLLQQAVGNLVSNGIKYAGAGKVVALHINRLTTVPILEHLTLDSSQTWCAIDIADNGPGIEEQDVKRIFDPFFRTTTARKGARPGSGLGLSIVQRAIQQHGGVVTVQSIPDEGTTFTLYLPLEQGSYRW